MIKKNFLYLEHSLVGIVEALKETLCLVLEVVCKAPVCSKHFQKTIIREGKTTAFCFKVEINNGDYEDFFYANSKHFITNKDR